MASKMKRTSAKRWFREMGESFGSHLYQMSMTAVYSNTRRHPPRSLPVWAQRAWYEGTALAQNQARARRGTR